MAKASAQTIRDAREFLKQRTLASDPDQILDTWTTDKRPVLPLRAALEARSDYSFVGWLGQEIEEHLVAEGISGKLSLGILCAVLAHPGLAMSMPDGDLTQIRHAVVIERSEPCGLPLEVLVKIDVWVRARHTPPGEKHVVSAAVERFKASCSLFDLEEESEAGRLLRTYIAYVKHFGPQQSARTRTHPVVVLGDPLALGSNDVPSHWRAELTTLARSLGAEPTFQHGPSFKGTIAENVAHVVRFEPYSGEDPTTHTGRNIPQTKIDARSADYTSIVYHLGQALLGIRDEEDLPATSPRALKPGERVFHRKMGNSGPYDNFDNGSDAPCSHGSEGFIRFYNSDKAVKGFRRRYTNFEDAWMHHCSKYPNCNMYAVFRPM